MPSTQLTAKHRAAIETFVADWLTDHRVPGAAIAVVDGDDVVYAEGFGARTLEDNTPATPDTLFGIGSCTKPFTAMAVLQLVEQDALALDDAIDDFLPHLADAPGAPITVEELLTHTSGMPSDGIAGPLSTRQLGVGHVEVPLSSEDDFRRHVQGSVDRRVTDGDSFFYYNSGYTMLGRIVEEASGQTFADYVTDNLLRPLGMERSTFSREAFDAETDRMTPYIKQDGASTEAGFPFDPLIQPAGGLLSSVRELTAFLRVFIGSGSAGDGIIATESLDAMTKPTATFGTYFDGREVGYGYGLMTEEFLGDRLVGHGGSIGVSNTWIGYLDDAELGVALACTTAPETRPMSVGPAVMALLRDEDPADAVAHYRLMDALAAVTGEYTDYRAIGTASVERVGGALKLTIENAAGGQEVLLVPSRIEHDSLVCTAMLTAGIEREARFDLSGTGVDLFFERTRLQKAE